MKQNSLSVSSIFPSLLDMGAEKYLSITRKQYHKGCCKWQPILVLSLGKQQEQWGLWQIRDCVSLKRGQPLLRFIKCLTFTGPVLANILIVLEKLKIQIFGGKNLDFFFMLAEKNFLSLQTKIYLWIKFVQFESPGFTLIQNKYKY